MSKREPEQGQGSDVAVLNTASESVSEPLQPPQEPRHRPGRKSVTRERPEYVPPIAGSGRLRGKVAVIIGGDSGIGRAVAIAMAREGADIAILYPEEHKDAEETVRLVEDEGTSAIRIAGDAGDEEFCRSAIERVLNEYGQIDILVNNAEGLSQIDIRPTDRTNIYSCFYTTKFALPHMKRGASIINYSATKSGIAEFTRSVSVALSEQGIRVNAVTSGPFWTSIIPALSETENKMASCFVFLASAEASHVSGRVLHPNGDILLNS